MATRDFSEYDPEVPLRCANHPDTETYLRCGKCEKPICARCRVSTPAGFRCFDCANLQVLPTYAVSTDYYLKAGLAGLITGGLTGVLMGVFPGFEFWVALLMGIAVAEGVAIAANQKRSQGLQILALGSILFGFVLSRIVIEAGLYRIFPMDGVNRPSPGGVPFLDSLPFYITQYTIIWLVLAMFLAYQRLK
jgi:hypothetical protein